MFDADEETFRNRFDQHMAADGTARLEGVGTDGVVVSGRRVYRCGNGTWDCHVLNPSTPCTVRHTPPFTPPKHRSTSRSARWRSISNPSGWVAKRPIPK